MAKAMKMSDRKNYFSRIRKSIFGQKSNKVFSERSIILAIKHDKEKGYFVPSRKIEELEHYEKEVMISKL